MPNKFPKLVSIAQAKRKLDAEIQRMNESFNNLNIMSGESEFPEPLEKKHRWELIDGSYMETTHDIPPWKNIILREADEKYKLIPVQIDRIGISNKKCCCFLQL